MSRTSKITSSCWSKENINLWVNDDTVHEKLRKASTFVSQKDLKLGNLFTSISAVGILPLILHPITS